MAETMMSPAEPKPSPAAADGYFPFPRKIDFHLARKHFSFGSEDSDFHLETLNPATTATTSANINARNSVYNKPSCSAPAGGKKKLDAGDDLCDPDLSLGITFRRIGAGLENLGNTCFLNSVLQCLTYTEPFAAYLQSGKHKSSCHTAGFCAMCALQNHVKRALQSTGRIVAPKDLVVNLRCISRNFRNARQEDAHEYMVNLLESMHKCCLPSGVPTESTSAYEKSLVHKIFGGRLRSQVKCMQCSYCSNTFDPFLDLSLEIVKADSVYKALAHFTATEQLDGGQKQYQCQRCKQKVRALKQLTVHKAPYVLTIHLKRFGSHITGQKIDKKVEFAPTLDLKPFVSGSYEGNLKYTLYGVLVHAGWSTHSGHYYCFVRTSSGMWHSLDDNRVVQVSEKVVLQQKAYMLFYVRDRKNVAPRKSVEVDSTNKMVKNVIATREKPILSMNIKKIVQNDSSTRGLSSSDCSSGVTQTDELGSGSSKEFDTKNTSIVKAKELFGSQSSLSKDRQLILSSKELVKETNVCCSTGDIFVAEGSPDSDSSSVMSSSLTSHRAFTHNDPKIFPGANMDKDKPEEQLSYPIVAVASAGGSESADPEKHIADKDILKNKGVAIERVLIEQQCQERQENLTSKEIGLAETLNQSSILNACIEMEAGDCHHKNVLKRKKLMKCRTATLRFSTKLLYRRSLRVCKKKKLKRNRKGYSDIRISTKCELEEIAMLGMGPSTSKETNMVAISSTHNLRKKKKSGSKKGCSSDAKDIKGLNGNSLKEAIKKDFIERNNLNSTVLATNESSRKKLQSTSAAKCCDAAELPSSNDSKRDLVCNNLASMVTRGLGDIRVAKWEEAESLPSHSLGSNGTRNISIGYVADEWDEEYDRGKRKKVRNTTNMFDGSNPFQEFATRKFQHKNGNKKARKGSSGNQPFRI